MIVALLSMLAGPATAWEPAPAPPPTAWAQAGARGWRLCDEVERQAIALSHGSGPRGQSTGEGTSWRKRAEQCPNAPAVLVLAAEAELGASARLGWSNGTEEVIESVVDDHEKRLEQALQWIDRAVVEAERRGEMVPHEALYYRAYALVGLGRYAEAREALQGAVRANEVERWRSDRMGAVVALLLGDLQEALRLAHRGVVDARPEDQQISRYIWAYVLDRAGAPASSRQELVQLRREAGDMSARLAVESLLPIHERLYLRALVQHATGDRGTAVRLWDAYLARPEPAEPDRELVRRHRAELNPPPPPVVE